MSDAAPRLDVPTLTQAVNARLRDVARTFGLDAATARATYVLNWGGFGAASFTLDDGARRLHLKLAFAEHEHLRRWHAVADHLTNHHHAPRLLGPFDLPGTAYAGLVFEHVAATHLDPRAQPAAWEAVVHAARRLHRDSALAEMLQAPQPQPTTCLDCFRRRYIEMFEEDLRVIEHRPPPFLPSERLRWMHDETARLAHAVEDNPAFSAVADAPCHWDLWPNNVLVRHDGAIVILDWDDLGFGDPVLDLATLAFPLVFDRPLDGWRSLPLPPLDAAERERMPLYLRGAMLDYVIDVLADWVECEAAPEHRDFVRQGKRREHELHFALYRGLYG